VQSEAILHAAPNVPGAAASIDASVSRPPPSPQPLHWPPLLPLDPVVPPELPPLLDPDVEPPPDDDELPVHPEPLLDDVPPPDPLPELVLPEPDDVDSGPVVVPVSALPHPAARSAATTEDDSRDTRTRVFMRVPPLEQPPCERAM
jgi:hypothetical protein